MFYYIDSEYLRRLVSSYRDAEERRNKDFAKRNPLYNLALSNHKSWNGTKHY